MQQNYVTEIEGVIKRNFVTPCISGFSDIIYLVPFLSLYFKLTEHFSKDIQWTVNQSCQNIGSDRYLLRSAKVIEATMKNCLSRQHSSVVCCVPTTRKSLWTARLGGVRPIILLLVGRPHSEKPPRYAAHYH